MQQRKQVKSGLWLTPGVKIDLTNEKGKKLVDLADEVGNEFIIEILQEFKPKNALVMAALSGNLEKLEKVVKKDGVDLNIKDWSYTRPSDWKTHPPPSTCRMCESWVV